MGENSYTACLAAYALTHATFKSTPFPLYGAVPPPPPPGGKSHESTPWLKITYLYRVHSEVPVR
jgi:hypothetical protein